LISGIGNGMLMRSTKKGSPPSGISGRAMFCPWQDTIMSNTSRVRSQPASTARSNGNIHVKAALTLLKLGFWAHLIHPGTKRPIGRAWGATRWDEAKIRETAERYPDAGVGVALGPDRAPRGGCLIDLEGDGDQAVDSLARFLGGEVPDTPEWIATRGNHTLFTADLTRLQKALIGAGAEEGTDEKGKGAWHLAELTRLEIRCGGYKADGKTVKQVQSVTPPTAGTDGTPRAWTVQPSTTVQPLPEASYAFLERLAAERTPKVQAPAGKGKGRAARRPGESYVMAALRDECDAVASEPEKNRNNRLNLAAYNLGQLVGAKALVRSEVETALTAAARQAGLAERETVATIKSGLDAGEAKPRDLSGIGTRSGNYGVPPSSNGDGRHQAEADPLNLTEWGNAKRLVAAHGTRLRYCKPLNQWFDWDGCRWCPDQSGAIWRWAKDTVRRLGHEAANTENDQRRQATLRWALKSEEKKVIAAMIELAWSEPGIAILPETLDRDPWMLNTPTGTIDLKTGKVRPHRQEDLISKITGVPFDPDAGCPRWEKVLLEIFAGDRDMVAYVKRALGYSLTGFIGEHALFLCYGTGRNGKNTVLDTVHTILGDYATIINPRVLLAAGKNDHPAAIADLMGRRFVPTDEVDEGEELAESLVKRLTGNKTLKGRFMRQNPFEFPALFKLWMLANCKPEIQGQDEGIWSRIRLIPFEVFFAAEKRIKGLADILVAEEGPGILRWLVDGCLKWQRIGLAEPEKILDAIKSYRNEQDVIGDFIDQCCVCHLTHPTLRDQARVKAGDLYGRYVDWCKENGEKKVLTNRRFSSKVTSRGYKLGPSNGVHYRYGITLKTVKPEACNDETDEDRPY
jgi:P4 family phage/plasmid primase-like protien